MDIAAVLFSIVLGIVQGISEFLPISSSGHLILVSSLTQGKPISLAVNTALHLGTLMAVFLFFWRDWYDLTVSLWKRIFQGEKSYHSEILFPSLIVGSIPAGIIGILFKDQIEVYFHHAHSVVLPLFLFGFVLWACDAKSSSDVKLEQLTLKQAFLIGVAQSLALIPGVSRSGATIAAARLLKFDRGSSARFSFLLGAPPMLGAVLLQIKDFQAEASPSFFCGIFTSCIVGCLTIKYFLKFIRNQGFMVFALYRAAVALAIFILT